MKIKTSKLVIWATIGLCFAVIMAVGFYIYDASFQSEVDQITDFIEHHFKIIVVALLVLILFKDRD